MNDVHSPPRLADREAVLHALYEAAELEHNLMCTYLYAAFSLKDGEADGLTGEESEAVSRWRQSLMGVAIEEMGHLAAVWNITSALGGTPRIGRTNFPIDPGLLPASVVVKLAPFDAATVQHFVYLERPTDSTESDGEGFTIERSYVRGNDLARLVPMGINYATVGEFYANLADGLRGLVARYGEAAVFCGDPGLQLSPDEIDLAGAKRVICLKTALAAFDAIVTQGEGAPRDTADSHFQKFLGVRNELRELTTKNASFAPAFPVATNPVLRRPPRPEGRVWLEDPRAIAAVDLANAAYGLMLRLIGYAYGLRGPSEEKSLVVDLAIGLMHAAGLLAERAARLPAGPSNPDCHAGMSFTALRDAAPLPPGRAAWNFFAERIAQLAEAGAAKSATEDSRVRDAADHLAKLSRRAKLGLELAATSSGPTQVTSPPPSPATDAAPAGEPSTIVRGVETVKGKNLELIFEARRCIHSRFCVTGAPRSFSPTWKAPGSIPMRCRSSESSKSHMPARRAQFATAGSTGRRTRSRHRSISSMCENVGPTRFVASYRSMEFRLASARPCAAAALRRGSHSATARTMRSDSTRLGSPRAARRICCRCATESLRSIPSRTARWWCAATWRSSAERVESSHAWSRRNFAGAAAARPSLSATTPTSASDSSPVTKRQPMRESRVSRRKLRKATGLVPPGLRTLTTRFRLNGADRAIAHEARVTLLDLLREQLELTGTKKGCNEGACGACTVLLDGRHVNACMILAATCEGRAVTTIEGIAGTDGTLHAVQRAFIEHDAFQCGYCTSGQIVSAVTCIREGHAGSEAEIAEWMSGNLCRCAGYPQIVAAVRQAAEQLAGSG